MDKTDMVMHEQAVYWPLPQNAAHLGVQNLVAVGVMPGRRERIILHEHETWEVDMVLEGEGRWTLPERSIAFKPGTVLVAPPGRAHGTAAEEGFRNMWVATEAVDSEQDIRVLELDLEHPLLKCASLLSGR